jgi:hypothetical protein
VLADFAGVLHMVFPDKTTGNLVHLQYNDTIGVWGSRLVTTFASHGTPALTGFNGSLALAYIDASGVNRLHAATWDPLVGWSTASNLGELSWGTPSVYTIGTASQIYLLFPANNSGRKILEITSTAVNETWSRTSAPNESSAYETSAAKFGNQAMMGFQSNNGKGQLFCSFYNGTAWLAHESVDSQTTSHTLAIAVLDGILNIIFSSHSSPQVVLWAQRPLLAYPLNGWMSHLNDDLYMSLLPLPGTHDSAAITWVPFTQTQTMSITAQLVAGIRFFDLRCVLNNDVLQMYHGAIAIGTTLQSTLQQMYNFFLNDDSSREALVVQIHQESDTQGSTLQFEYAVYEAVQA